MYSAETDCFGQDEIQLLVEEIKDYAIFILNTEGRVAGWNAGAKIIKGYSAGEILGQHFSCFYTAKDIEQGKPAHALQVAASTGRYEEQGWRVRKDGSRFWAEVVIIALRDDAGNLRGFGKVTRDVTKRQRAEEALQENQERLSGPIASAMDAIISIDSQQNIVLFNAAAEQMFQCPQSEVLGRPLDRFIPERFRAAHREHVESFGRSGVTIRKLGKSGEIRGLRADGQEFPIEASVSQVETAQGRFYTTILRDITERKQAEEALQQSEERFRATFEQAAVGIAHVAPDGRWLRVNQKLCNIIGYTQEELLERTFRDVTYSVDLDADLEYIQQMLAGEIQMFSIEKRYVRKDCSLVWVNVTVSLVREPSGEPKYFIGIAEDINQRKQAESEILYLNTKLEQRVAERTAELTAVNKELEAFAYSVSHDLRAPLRHIDSFIGLLRIRADSALDSQAHRFLDIIGEAARKMGVLIDDLLDFSRMSRAELVHRPVNMEQLVKDVIQKLECEARERPIIWSIGAMPEVEADPTMLYLVLMNLLGNAVKFTGKREQPRIAVGCLMDQPGEVVFFVRDNGAGFDMSYADKLFGVFQRLHRTDEFEGTGIGLANVKRIIHRHGGRVWAEGQVDAGATFYFSLPAPAQRG